MGFIKRLLGLETRPGEPKPVHDRSFDEEVMRDDLPSFVYFYHLWCSSCQVMGGLLNEIGPLFTSRARFFKININKDPSVPQRLGVTGVPTIVVLKNGRETDRLVGLTPLNPLREWVERQLDTDLLERQLDNDRTGRQPDTDLPGSHGTSTPEAGND
ncbi:MAG: hypothetical protein JSV33_07440 [bacterium]|nr:MAG: hypothetical protein JSV33_07440 [bacterium]